MNKNIRLLILCAVALPLASISGQTDGIPTKIKKHIKSVSPDAIREHVAYLADDRLKGRLPGTPEFELAIEYVEQQYRALGLLPAGENGSYRQKVTIRTAQVVAEESSLHIIRGASDLMTYGKDFVFVPDLKSTSSGVEASVVFAGYGIAAPELGYDDYAGIDARGRIVVILSGTPPDKFQAAENAHLGNLRSKLEMAHEKGAQGVLLLPPPDVGNNFTSFANRLAARSRGIVLPDEQVDGLRVNSFSNIQFTGVISWEGIGKLLGQPGQSSRELAALLYTGREKIAIEGRIRAKVISRHEDLISYNVAGLIPGVDPVLKEEFVVHSAHLDHVGIGVPVDGDSIYNGAHDNASGVASLLEIARLYSRLKKDQPKRSILFVMVTAEEMGLLGSLYFARNPTIPQEKIVANVNTDMPTLIAPLLSIEPLGAEHSSLIRPVTAAAQHLGLSIMPDHMPEQVRFIRSDQYSFILQGIPALHVKYGLKTNDPGFDLEAHIQSFTRNDYHKPSDEVNDSFDFEAGRTYVQLNFLISYLVAQNAERPAWNPDSFFARFGKTVPTK